MEKPTILIVDDDTVSLNLLTKLVESLKYNVLCVPSGRAALECLRAQSVALIISDYDMPELNGIELLRMCKAEYPQVPFILVTAFSNLKVIREAWENGAFDFFQKPVFVDRLTQTVRMAIEYGHLSFARRKFPRLEQLQPDPDVLNVGVVRELAAAIDRTDLLNIVEEFDTRARIELEQMMRFSTAANAHQVLNLSHSLAGTSINLGLVQLASLLRNIEKHPDDNIQNFSEIEQVLAKSVYWLKHCLLQIYEKISA